MEKYDMSVTSDNGQFVLLHSVEAKLFTRIGFTGETIE